MTKLCLICAQTATVAIITRLPATVIRVEEGTRHLFCIGRMQDTALAHRRIGLESFVPYFVFDQNNYFFVVLGIKTRTCIAHTKHKSVYSPQKLN